MRRWNAAIGVGKQNLIQYEVLELLEQMLHRSLTLDGAKEKALSVRARRRSFGVEPLDCRKDGAPVGDTRCSEFERNRDWVHEALGLKPEMLHRMIAPHAVCRSALSMHVGRHVGDHCL